MVHGKLRHSQSQGSNAMANQDIEQIFTTWLKDSESTSWSHTLNLFSS